MWCSPSQDGVVCSQFEVEAMPIGCARLPRESVRRGGPEMPVSGFGFEASGALRTGRAALPKPRETAKLS